MTLAPSGFGMRTLVVLPTYNEADNIAEVLRRLRTAVPAADVLVVDDGSPDGTAEIARALRAELGGIDVLTRAGKLGLGSAYRDGFLEGLRRGYQVLVEMDGDLSHDPAALPGLLTAVDDGADLAVGSRYVSGGAITHWSTRRRALSRWGNRYARWVLALPLADATSGFRAFRADVVARLDLHSIRADGYGFQIEMAYRVARAGGEIVEVPITFVDRRRGASKMSLHIAVEALLLVTWWGVSDLAGGRRAVWPVRARSTKAMPTVR
jgi:dolichol-phosphate mannosyltransferase